MAVQEALQGEWAPPPDASCGLPVDVDTYISQVRKNCRLDLPNVNTAMEHDLIMVMVCAGPTMPQFLDDIRKKSQDKNKYRIFCSNKTHDYLIDNGIIPDYHFIIDPKPSMLTYVQRPHKDVQYLIGSCCVPQVFEALEGYDVKRLMVLSGVKGSDGITDMHIIQALYNKSEYTGLEGGTMAGLRAMTLANMLGYKTVEFYGFDSGFQNYDENGEPIYYAYDKKRIENVVECKTDDRKIYDSTPVFASQARQFIKWKHRLEWIKFIIYGDSLTSRIDKIDEEERRPKHDLLITDYMQKMNEELHKDWDGEHSYGSYGSENLPEIVMLAGQMAKRFGELTILDYGCGKGFFKMRMPDINGVTVHEYDPCVKEKSARPKPADLVVCTDVLEHIEPQCLDNVLDDIERLTVKSCFVSICLTPAVKKYHDGQNCHLSLLDAETWYAKLRKRFLVLETKEVNVGEHRKIKFSLQKKGYRYQGRKTDKTTDEIGKQLEIIETPIKDNLCALCDETCCVHCAEKEGFYFVNNDNDERFKSQIEALKNEYAFDNQYGFFDNENKNCRIPRRIRSIKCQSYFCKRAQKYLNDNFKAKQKIETLCDEMRYARIKEGLLV